MAKFTFWNNVSEVLRNWQKLLSGGLTFSENISCSTWTGEIEAGATVGIPHNLKQVPAGFLILNARGTNNLIQAETPPSDSERFWIKNQASSSTFKGRIAIIRG
jgi:hypothetical protein